MSNLIPRLLDYAVAIQQIPSPTFHEKGRAEFVRTHFLEEGLDDVEIDSTGNVLARLPANRKRQRQSSRSLVISAHLDTVFPVGTNLRFVREPDRIFGAGIGDNAVGVAGLFGLLWAIREQEIKIPHDIWLVGNVCEEGLGGLRGIRAVVDRFGKSALAYIIMEGMAFGQVYHRALGVQRYRIWIRTEGGHSWIDYGKPSAVHELAALVPRLTAIELPSMPRTTLNVGTISGGTSINSIASEAMLELDLRSESREILDRIAVEVEGMVDGARRAGVEASAEVIDHRPAGELLPEHPLVLLAQDCLRQQGVEPHLNIGSTDANYPISLGLPAVTIGLTTGRCAHTVQEYINTEPLEKGIRQILDLLTRIRFISI